MINLLIERDNNLSGPQGTRGRLFDVTNPNILPLFRWYTVERPRLGEHPCISDGKYDCVRMNSPSKGNTFEILVQGRTHILFHVANNMADLEGCIGLGKLLDSNVTSHAHPETGPLPGVTMSVKAVTEFKDFLSDVDDFKLIIVTK